MSAQPSENKDNHWFLRLIEIGRSEKVLKLLEEQNSCQILAADYQRRSDEIDETLRDIALHIWTEDDIRIAKEYAKRIDARPYLATI
jgi:hypothetical protein